MGHYSGLHRSVEMQNMEDHLNKVQLLMQQQIDLQRNLMVQGLVGINEARAGSPRSTFSHKK